MASVCGAEHFNPDATARKHAARICLSCMEKSSRRVGPGRDRRRLKFLFAVHVRENSFSEGIVADATMALAVSLN